MKCIVIGQGKMGNLIRSRAEELGHEVIAQGDRLEPGLVPEKLGDADVILDFSHPDNLDWVLELNKGGVPYVCGTTGLSEEQMQNLEEASRSYPVFWSSNYSLGIAVLKQLAKAAMDVLGQTFDVEVVEAHHNQKKDAPSGTALSLVEAMDPEGAFERVYGRSGLCPRGEKEIGIHAVRGGSVAGEHEILFLGPDETLSLKHGAGSRIIFVNGAIQAAQWLVQQPAGLYSMERMLG